MPRVGKEKFPYTAKGKKAAKAYAGKVGKEVEEYQGGGEVNFPQENPAIAEANKMGQEMRSISLEGIPTSDAMDRKQTSPIGAEVGTGMYKEGGFVKKAIGKLKDKRRIKKLEKSLKGLGSWEGHQSSKRELAYLKQKGKEPTHKITGIAKPKKKGLKPAKVSSNPPLIPHYGAKGRSSIENLITDSVYGAGASKKRYEKEEGKAKAKAKPSPKKQKVAPKGGHSLEPAPVTRGRKKKKKWA